MLLVFLRGCVQGFSKSLVMTVLFEIRDKTFFAVAILAMRHPRKLVLAGCLTALRRLFNYTKSHDSSIDLSRLGCTKSELS